MPNQTLGLPSIELSATDRPFPANGAPSSEDYNDTLREFLADFVSVTTFINETLRPILNTLPSSASDGLEGRTIYADSTDRTQLFYDAKTATSLSLADSIRLLNGMLTSMTNKVADLGNRVTLIDSKLSATNQNDISNALQSFNDLLVQLSNRVLTVEKQLNIS